MLLKKRRKEWKVIKRCAAAIQTYPFGGPLETAYFDSIHFHLLFSRSNDCSRNQHLSHYGKFCRRVAFYAPITGSQVIEIQKGKIFPQKKLCPPALQ